MNAKYPRRRLLCPWILATFTLAIGTLTYGQDPFPTPSPTPDPLAGVPVKILDQQEITIGAHTITYNRIAPPVFPPATPAATPDMTPEAAASLKAVPLKRAANSAWRTRSYSGSEDEKQYAVFSPSATVYDHKFTALRWYDGPPPGLQVYVNADLSSVSTFEAASRVYEMIFAVVNDSTDSLTQAGQPLPDFSSVPAGHSGFQIVAGDPNAHPDAIAALNALCAYYDANSTQMIAAYNQQQANNASYQQWLKAHPPVQPNTVINFWPVKSGVYPVNH